MAWIDFRNNGPRPGAGTGSGEWELAALTFFDPRFSGSREIVELIELLDTFSGDHIDIVISGCTPREPTGVPRGSIHAYRNGDAVHYYCAQTLSEHVAELQSMSSWRFSMELDVILLNRKRWWNSVDSGVQYDFENAIVLNLYRMLKDGKISSYAGFFAEIIDFAVQYGGGSNPAWALSDTKLVSGVKDSLFSALKKYFGIKNALATFEDYAIRDLTKA